MSEDVLLRCARDPGRFSYRDHGLALLEAGGARPTTADAAAAPIATPSAARLTRPLRYLLCIVSKPIIESEGETVEMAVCSRRPSHPFPRVHPWWIGIRRWCS